MLIHNITDIDDKIIAKAIKTQQSESSISAQYTNHYLSLLKKFNVLKPQKMPTVTENIKRIIKFIELLIAKQAAYSIGSNVWFDVSTIKDYGQLSHQKLDKLMYDHEDGKVSKEKKHPADFVLWKKTQLGVTFKSPWGQGRPGWHTECVAIIDHYLKGKSLSIHGGGIDLLFPHHENEQAQFKAMYGKDLAQTWIHVGHISIEGLKMSKSLNNTWDAEEFANQYGVDTLRMLFLLNNPKSPIDLSQDKIIYAQQMVQKFTKTFKQSQLYQVHKFDQQMLENMARTITNGEFTKVMAQVNEQIKQFNLYFKNGFLIQKMLQLIGFKFANRKLTWSDKQLFKKWNQLKKHQKFHESDQIRAILQKKDLI